MTRRPCHPRRPWSAALLLLCAALLVPAAAAAADASDTADARPLAVWFYADWCMNCKLIAPKLKRLQPEYETRVQFVRLDYTDEARKAPNRGLARELGFHELYLSNRATGWVALLDREGQRLGELRHAMTLEDMRAALDAAVAALAGQAR